MESADKVKYTVIGVHRMPNGADYHRSSGFVPIVVYKELQAQKFKEFEISTFHKRWAPYIPQSNGRVETECLPFIRV